METTLLGKLHIWPWPKAIIKNETHTHTHPSPHKKKVIGWIFFFLVLNTAAYVHYLRKFYSLVYRFLVLFEMLLIPMTHSYWW